MGMEVAVAGGTSSTCGREQAQEPNEQDSFRRDYVRLSSGVTHLGP